MRILVVVVMPDCSRKTMMVGEADMSLVECIICLIEDRVAGCWIGENRRIGKAECVVRGICVAQSVRLR